MHDYFRKGYGSEEFIATSGLIAATAAAERVNTRWCIW